MGNCCSSPPANAAFFKRTTCNLRCLSSTSTEEEDDEEDDGGPLPAEVLLPSPPLWVLGERRASAGEDLVRRYRVGEELGRGEFGVTRRCEEVGTGKAVACKTIAKGQLRTAVDVEDVRREVEIMRALPPHPNVVRLRDAYEDAEAVHIVMEICEGGELFDRIVARGHYGERAAASVIRTIVDVVQHCHQHGVMHRDLKPENFLFANQMETSPLKAIDFGLSVFFRPGERFNDIVGSPYYMAPEVLKRDYGPEADVWSAGVILYILLCGVPPFWAETDEGIARAIVRSVVNFEREPWPKITEKAKDLVNRMLDPNPYTRLTAKEVLEHPWLQNAKSAPDTCLGEAVISRLKQFSAMNKFKKRALRVVAEQLTGDEVATIKQMFHMMDTDKNGNLTLEELKEGFQSIGEPIPDPDVKLLMEAGDVDGNGTLNCEEFVTVSVHLRRITSDEHLSKAFNYFDKNNSGYIEIDELREALGEHEHGPSEEVIRDIVNDVDKDKGDVDGNGTLNCEEFVTVSVHLRRITSDEHLSKAFNYFDKNNSGYIEIDELREALGEHEHGPSEEVIRDIVNDVDKDKDGRISYEEFALMMKAGTDWRAASRQYSRAVLSNLSHKLFKDGCVQR